MDRLEEATQNLTLDRSRRRSSYLNSLTGQEISWLEQKRDDSKLSTKVELVTEFFQPSPLSQIEWLSMTYIDGNEKVSFGRIQGAVPMGLVKLEPGGYFRLHWHNGKPVNNQFLTAFQRPSITWLFLEKANLLLAQKKWKFKLIRFRRW